MNLHDELTLHANQHKRDLSEIKNKRTRDEQLNCCAIILSDIISSSTICVIGENIYRFNGRIYEPVAKMEYKSGLYMVLTEFGVPPVIARQMPDFIMPFLWRSRRVPKHSLIAFTNGVFDYEAGRLQYFDPSLSCTYQVPYEYSKEAGCPIWDAFLQQVLPDETQRMQLQEFIGMIYIDRRKTKIEKALVLIGEGANGKSVIFNVVRALVGDKYVSNLSPLQMRDDRHLFELTDKRLNYCSEVRANDTMDSALKALISAEPVAAWGLYKGVSYVVCPPIIFTMNRYPNIDDRTFGFFRRMLPIRFNVTIPPELQNKELADAIIQKELSGIFNWAMEGRRRLLMRKGEFSRSDALDTELERMEAESSPILQFMLDNGFYPRPQYHGQPSMRLKASDLFAGMSQIDARSASKQLQSKGFRRMKSGVMYYVVYPSKDMEKHDEII